MADAMWGDIVGILCNNGVEFEPGLTDAEVAAVESRHGFRFPPDLRAFLQAGLPVGGDFPDWRDGEEVALRRWLELPRRGILFDIEHNGFWLDEWGPRSASLGEAQRIAGELVSAAPKLIPIYKHRLMPSEPHAAGNPVFSVHQTDIIYYGVDLRDYLIHEFLAREDVGVWPIPETVRRVPFWDIERFLSVRWAGGACVLDNSAGQFP
ncbi:SMI1/KNR4 family protein [Zavarzinella formosa]|uniref:SMI1/KNR4 family protein n=1 Tax=Zavarzinella formosa TaxID=360055 RepID=UPI0002D66A23|nr:SMI1/KNR4 family protein [Zavarzinella formosa]